MHNERLSRVDQLAVEIALIRVTSLFYVDIDVKLYGNYDNHIKQIIIYNIKLKCLKSMKCLQLLIETKSSLQTYQLYFPNKSTSSHFTSSVEFLQCGKRFKSYWQENRSTLSLQPHNTKFRRSIPQYSPYRSFHWKNCTQEATLKV